MQRKTYSYLKMKLVLIAVAFIASCADYQEGTEAQKVPGTNRSAIMGGDDAQPHAYPWMVQIKKNGEHHCGGALITPEWVLTAAHCITFWALEDYTVVAGEHTLSVPEGSEQEVAGDVRVTHEDFDIYVNDIALFHLAEPLVLNEQIQTISLNPEVIGGGVTTTLSGWGRMAENDISDALQVVELPSQTAETCNDAGTLPSVVDDETMLCVGYVDSEASACHRDSGGPLVTFDENGEASLVGVVNWGKGGSCDSYSVFARLSTYIDWIAEKIAADYWDPTMLSITPAYGTSGVPLDTPLQAVFSEAIDPDSFDVELVNYSADTILTATAELSEDGTTIVVSADEPLEPLSIHGLLFHNVTDLAGNLLVGEYRSFFMTAEAPLDAVAPTTLSITPAYGTSGVPLGTPLQAVFSEAIDPDSFHVELADYSADAIYPVNAELSENGTTIVVTNDEPLAPLAIHGLLFHDVTDLAGNPLVGEYRSLFMTGR